MSKRSIHIEELIIKFARGQRLTRQELAELKTWQSRSEDHQTLPEKFQDPNWLRENLRRMENVPSDRMWDFIRDRIALSVENEPLQTPGHLRRLKQWAPYAAAALVLVVGGWLLFKNGSSAGGPEDIPVPVLARADVRAQTTGNHQVLLTMADGRVFPLDHVPNGLVAEDGNLILTKTDSNKLEYSLKPGTTEVAINSRVTTGQSVPFHLVFPDGSTAQLNFSSSLSTTFREGQRELALAGEALFQTVKNSNQPFTVHIKGAKVEVLGTQFNVMSYADEAAGAITLFNGAVKVTNPDESKLLKPLQQALVGGDRMVVHTVDTLGILSWTRKDPVFRFDNTDLNTVIRRIARWHQVKVYNPDNVAGIPITGIFRQKESLEVTLGMLDRVESGNAFLKRRGDTIEISAAVAAR